MVQYFLALRIVAIRIRLVVDDPCPLLMRVSLMRVYPTAPPEKVLKERRGNLYLTTIKKLE
jgi:hypothetical protein